MVQTKNKMLALYCGAVLLFFLQGIAALPSGAPTTACSPSYISPHGQPVVSNDVAVQFINPASLQVVGSYENGVPLEIRVSRNSQAPLHGIMVVAVHSDGTYVSNAFQAIDTSIQTRNCVPSSPNSMATHTSASSRNQWSIRLNPTNFRNDEITVYTTVISKTNYAPSAGDEVLRSVTSLKPRAAPVSTVPTTPAYAYTQSIDSRVTVYYTAANGVLDFKAEINQIVGWFGCGFSQDGGMANSDVVIGESATMTAAPYRISGAKAVLPATAAPVSEPKMAYEGSKTVITFKRALAANDLISIRRQTAEYANNIVPGGTVNFIYAFGQGSTLSMHSPTDRSGAYFSLNSTPESSSAATSVSSTKAVPTTTTASAISDGEKEIKQTTTAVTEETKPTTTAVTEDAKPTTTVVTEATNPTTTAAVETSVQADAALYENTQQIDDRVTVFYTVDNDVLNLKVELNQVAGWFGCGFSEDGSMENSDVVIGESASMSAAPYRITGTDSSSILPANSAPVSKSTMKYENGKTVITFERSMSVNELASRRRQTGQYGNSLVAGETVHFIYAFGETSTISYHGPNRASVPITLKSSKSSSLNTIFYPPTSTTTNMVSTSLVETPTTSKPALVAIPGSDNYTFTVSLSDQVQVSYNLRDTEIDVKAVLLGQKAGWFGIGFGDTPGVMINSDVVIGQSANMQAEPFRILAYSSYGIAPVPQNSISLSRFYYEDAGNTVVEFTRSLAPTTGNSVSRKQVADTFATAISNASPANLIYAFGSSSTVMTHRGTDRGAATLALTQGSATAKSVGVNPKIIAHGALMFIAWGVLSPIAIYFAAFTKAMFRKTGKPAGWFHAHRYMQIVSIACMIAGVILAAIQVNQTGSHVGAHKVLGIITLILAFSQPFNAIIRPHPPINGEKKSKGRLIWEIAHRLNGWIAAVMGIITMSFGLYLNVAQTSDIIKGLYFAWISVLVVAAIPLFWLSKRTEKQLNELKATGGPLEEESQNVHHSTPVLAQEETKKDEAGYLGPDKVASQSD